MMMTPTDLGLLVANEAVSPAIGLYACFALHCRKLQDTIYLV